MQNSPSSPGGETMQGEIALISWRQRLASWYTLYAEQKELGNAVVSAILWFALLGYAGSAVLTNFAAKVEKFDGAIPLVHGRLIQQGHTPNLDFYSFYPPLGLYVNAALFSLLGRTVLATRVFAAVLYLLLLLAAARFFRFRCAYSRPLVPAAMLVVASSIGNTIERPPWPGLAVSIVALLTYLFSQGGVENPLWAVGVSGLLTGFALLYRINFGAYVVMAVAFNLLLPWVPRGGTRRDRLHLRKDLLTATVFLGPLAVSCAAFSYWVYGRHAVTAVVNLVVQAQRLMILRGFIELPFSMGIACAVALPTGWFFLRMLMGAEVIPMKALVPAAFTIALLSITLVGHTHFSVVPILTALEIASVVFLHLFVYRLTRSELCLLLFCCGLLHYYLSRADFPHGRVMTIGAALLLPLLVSPRSDLIESEPRSSVSKGTGVAVMLAASFVCFVSSLRPVAMNLPRGTRLLETLVRHPHLTDTDRVLGPAAPDAPWLAVYPDRDELQALRYLRANSSSADAIFSGVPDHSTIYGNNLLIYWLADRPIGVRTFQLEARVATEVPIQQGIVADLEQNKVKWVLIDGVRVDPDPTFAAHPYVGSKLLDQYIASHYRVEARFGAYVVCSRKAVGQAGDCKDEPALAGQGRHSRSIAPVLRWVSLKTAQLENVPVVQIRN